MFSTPTTLLCSALASISGLAGKQVCQHADVGADFCWARGFGESDQLRYTMLKSWYILL